MSFKVKQYLILFAAILAASSAAHEGAAAVAVTPSSELNRTLLGQKSGAADPFSVNRPTEPTIEPKRANFGSQSASRDAHYVADWVVDSGDNKKLPFAVVDKAEAKVFVFTADGRLRGATAALLGLALGDESVPGIGDRALSSIRPHERTTPAGRFLARKGPSLNGGTVLWINYDEGLALHPLRPSNPAERRPQRLASPTPLDNRISLGCVVVPVKFFQTVVLPAFTRNGVIYVLPETKLAGDVFASYDVDEHARQQWETLVDLMHATQEAH